MRVGQQYVEELQPLNLWRTPGGQARVHDGSGRYRGKPSGHTGIAEYIRPYPDGAERPRSAAKTKQPDPQKDPLGRKNNYTKDNDNKPGLWWVDGCGWMWCGAEAEWGCTGVPSPCLDRAVWQIALFSPFNTNGKEERPLWGAAPVGTGGLGGPFIPAILRRGHSDGYVQMIHGIRTLRDRGGWACM